MSHNAVERARDGERFALAILLALLLHAAVAILIPAEFLRPLPDFEPPLYVEFEPLPPVEPRDPPTTEEPPVTEPPTPERTEPPVPAEPEEVPELASGDGDPAAAAPPVDPEPPRPPTFVPEEAPPAPERSVDRRELERSNTQRSDEFVEAELARYYEFQRDWIDARDDWEERTAAGVESGERAPEEPDAAPLEDQLRRVLEGIRRSAAGDPRVVDLADDPARRNPGDQGPGGDGSGIRIGDETGGRYRISAGTLDLSDLRLPAGFPVEYPLSCRIRVTADGSVIAARVDPPSPSQELNDRVSAWVGSWVFQPADSAGITETSFTIILRTR